MTTDYEIASCFGPLNFTTNCRNNLQTDLCSYGMLCTVDGQATRHIRYQLKLSVTTDKRCIKSQTVNISCTAVTEARSHANRHSISQYSIYIEITTMWCSTSSHYCHYTFALPVTKYVSPNFCSNHGMINKIRNFYNNFTHFYRRWVGLLDFQSQVYE